MAIDELSSVAETIARIRHHNLLLETAVLAGDADAAWRLRTLREPIMNDARKLAWQNKQKEYTNEQD